MQDIKSFKRNEEPLVPTKSDPVEAIVVPDAMVEGAADPSKNAEATIVDLRIEGPAITEQRVADEAETVGTFDHLSDEKDAPKKMSLKISIPAQKPQGDDEVRLSGSDPETDEEEYKKIFNGEVAEVASLTNDELQDHIHKLMTIVKVAKIRWKASYITMAQRLEDETIEERKRLAARDKEFRPKPPVDPNKPARIKAVGKTVEEKAVSAMAQALGISEERAREIIAKQKK